MKRVYVGSWFLPTTGRFDLLKGEEKCKNENKIASWRPYLLSLMFVLYIVFFLGKKNNFLIWRKSIYSVIVTMITIIISVIIVRLLLSLKLYRVKQVGSYRVIRPMYGLEYAWWWLLELWTVIAIIYNFRLIWPWNWKKETNECKSPIDHDSNIIWLNASTVTIKHLS
jgi:ribose/xylose/arabinose/galactoside ABC-type transport system permease subunit